MTVVGIARVKDEADIIEATVRRMLTEVDHVVVEDNGSTDGTIEVLHRLGVEVLEDPEVGYYQSRAMSRLAAYAHRAYDADWVVPFDADERWYSPHGRVADVLSEHPGASIATADLYDHVPSADDTVDGDPIDRIGWRRREPAPLAKVAVRPRPAVTIHQGNHSADHGRTIDGLLVVRHFPYRSAEQMIRKARNGAAAYAATDLPEHIGQHWRDYGRLTDEQIADVFRRFFWAPAPRTDRGLIFDPAP